MIHLSEHAIIRYQERVKPHMTFKEAKAEAMRLLEQFAVISSEPPKWFMDSGDHDPFTGFAMICDGIAFGLHNDTALTCLTCGGLGEPAREARNHQRRGRQRMRHAKRQKWKDHKQTNRDRGAEPRRKDWDVAA